MPENRHQEFRELLEKRNRNSSDDNPYIHGACADNMLFMRKHPFIRKLIEIGGMMT